LVEERLEIGTENVLVRKRGGMKWGEIATGRAKKWKTRGGGGDDEVMKLVGRKS
jgi:hypothetical protein